MAFYAGIFVPLMIRTMEDSQDVNPDLNTEDKRTVAAFFALMLLGAGEILGGIMFIGPIRDKLGNKVAYLVQMILTALSIAILLLYNQNNVFNWMAYAMCFTWGI